MKQLESFLDYHLYDLWVTCHPMEILRPSLKKRGFLTRAELAAMPVNSLVKVAGRLITVHTPPTRSGKRVMFITVEDETGLIDLVAFENVQKRWAKEIFTSEILMVEGVLKKDGKNEGAVSITIRKIIT